MAASKPATPPAEVAATAPSDAPATAGGAASPKHVGVSAAGDDSDSDFGSPDSKPSAATAATADASRTKNAKAGAGGSGAGSGGGASSSPGSTDTGCIARVHVHHAPTAVCLFDRAWSWRTDCQREVISSLVQSFHQFAREIDDGVVSNVRFAAPVRHAHKHHHSGHAGHGRRHSSKGKTADDVMELLTVRDGVVIASVFHNVVGAIPLSGPPASPHASALVQRLAATFQKEFGDAVARLDSKELRTASQEGRTGHISALFDGFKASADKLRAATIADIAAGRPAPLSVAAGVGAGLGVGGVRGTTPAGGGKAARGAAPRGASATAAGRRGSAPASGPGAGSGVGAAARLGGSGVGAGASGGATAAAAKPKRASTRV